MEYMKEYSALALRTLKPLSQYDDLRHAALGMVSEIGEIADLIKAKMVYGKTIDPLSILEEVGDAYWFANLAAERAGLRFVELDTTNLDCSAFAGVCRATSGASEFAGLVCNSYSPRDDRPLPTLSSLIALCSVSNGLSAVLSAYDFTVAQALKANVAKLSTRYPDKYSDEYALIRDKEAERHAMEVAR